MKRKEIKDLISDKQNQIKSLEDEILELRKEDILLCDDTQWFTEEEETIHYRENRKKVSTQKLIGRVHWKETFHDEDGGTPIVIDRSCIVRVDGEWQ